MQPIITLSPYAEEVSLDISLRLARDGTLDREAELAILQRELAEQQICEQEIQIIRGRFKELL